MIPDAYVWFVWASAFLIPWAGLFFAYPQHRKTMLWASFFTMPFGLTEPLFVPEYWNPPSLFDLAARTGFDIESLIFSFGIGGVGSVLFGVLSGRSPQRLPTEERQARRHRFHRWVLASPFVVFLALSFFPWNAIYPGIVAMGLGAIAAVVCRPDLTRATLAGGAIFLVYYLLFLIGLKISVPGYIDKVWNLEALSGWTVGGLPLEELLFAAAFGMYWGGVYEHFTWHRAVGTGESAAHV
jgi:hypothetical protein